MLASARPRYAAVLEGLRRISPRSQGTLGQEGLSSAIALGGLGCRRSYARRGLLPLRCGFGWAPRDPALRSQVSSGKDELSRYARGVVVIASNARVGPIPLRCGFGWAPQDQALRSQVSSNKEELLRCARGGEVDRFQCLLRPDPATLRF